MDINIYVNRYKFAPENNVLTTGGTGEHRGEHFFWRGELVDDYIECGDGG